VAVPILTPADEVALLLAVVGLALAAWAARELSLRRRDRSVGELQSIDAGRPETLRSVRYRIAGRPDAVRRLPDGRRVPVEVKSRPTPSRGPAPSHVVQVRAYCLLLEDVYGVAPPYGLLRYSDGEFQVRWDAEARRELIELRARLDRPYRGEATPSRARCGRCPWRSVCDARAG